MIEIEKQDLTSLNIKADQLQKLKQLLPEVFTEGNKVDWDRLKLTLGESIDSTRERFGMNWPGKADCFKTIQQPSIATLVPDREESVNFDTTENLFIEGDNLEVLKLLQKSYLGKIKMIYIDPPYNTGNDFIYPDNYSESLDTYLEYTGQVDGEGRKFSTNTDTDGRFHSKWMNMMYPRLFLAKNLLREDGVIFISIDDHEVHNLRDLCNEIFGEENFVALMTLLCNPKGRAQDKHFAANHEYVLVMSKNPLPKGSFCIEKEIDQLDKEYTEEDDFGKYRTIELRNTHREFGRYNRKNLFYPLYVNSESGDVQLINDEKYIEVLPIWSDGFEGCWTWGKPKAEQECDFLIGKKVNGTWKIFVKDYANGSSKMLKTILLDKSFYTEKGQKTFNELFNSKKKIFPSPKSKDLLIQLFKTSLDSNDIVLDFFAGSATTAHAILDLNKEDNGHRKFICVQLPEPTDEKSEAFKAGYKTIADISKERIRRVINKIEKEQNKKAANERATLFGEQEKTNLDLGFKVFKLQPSNFKIWDESIPKESDAIQQALFSHIDHISPEARQEAILYELLLKSGFEPTTPIEQLILEGKTVFSISDGALLICLEKELTYDAIKAMAECQPTRVICLDEGFQNNDQLKTNAVQIMKSKNVINFRTI